ncbi:DUF305 domain-containing protein [Thalassospira marina]|uniref:DUF305 domain-containing protein n=1 Tax=Thalassospira marina TaxID=2048283 RepID=A0ABM6Q5X1_9PROT|nr:DUF305 domain-containing protein [Thalassospira marina]AUG51314.1 DUF305 domain-containing protein [Thalassospira marina]
MSHLRNFLHQAGRHIAGSAICFALLGGGAALAHNGVDHNAPNATGHAAGQQGDPAQPAKAGASDAANNAAALAHEQPFLDGNANAMAKMMSAMHVAPTGDIDRDFVTMMAPHHQGAIDMCVAFLPYATNPQLKRLCQEIIVTQQQEIAAMYLAIGKALPPSTPAPTH